MAPNMVIAVTAVDYDGFILFYMESQSELPAKGRHFSNAGECWFWLQQGLSVHIHGEEGVSNWLQNELWAEKTIQEN